MIDLCFHAFPLWSDGHLEHAGSMTTLDFLLSLEGRMVLFLPKEFSCPLEMFLHRIRTQAALSLTTDHCSLSTVLRT
jgi:hypothetical protein